MFSYMYIHVHSVRITCMCKTYMSILPTVLTLSFRVCVTVLGSCIVFCCIALGVSWANYFMYVCLSISTTSVDRWTLMLCHHFSLPIHIASNFFINEQPGILLHVALPQKGVAKKVLVICISPLNHPFFLFLSCTYAVTFSVVQHMIIFVQHATCMNWICALQDLEVMEKVPKVSYYILTSS